MLLVTVLVCLVLGLLLARPLERLDERLRRWPRWLLPTLVTVPVAALYLVHLWAKHASFDTWATDDGLFAQAMWHLSRGQVPASSLLGLPSLWDEHFTPILVLLAPLYRLWPDVFTLLAVQVLAVAAGGYAVWGLGMRWLDSPVAAGAAVFAYLASVPMQYALHFSFHPVTLAIPLLLGAAWCEGRARWLLLALAGLAQEDAWLFVAFFGLALAATGHRRPGLVVFVLAGLAFALTMASFDDSYRFVGLFGRFGSGPLGVLTGVATHPLQALGALVDDPVKVRTLTIQAAPGLLLWLLSPWTLLALPMLGENFLADRPSQWEVVYHYAAPAASVLLLGALHGARRVARARAPLAVSLAVTPVAFSLLVGAPLLDRVGGALPWPSAADLRRAELLQRVPAEAAVVAQPALVTHLANRARLQDDDPVSMFLGDPLALRDWDYVVYDLGVTSFPYDRDGLRARVRKALDAGYGVDWQEEGLLVLRRGADGRPEGAWAAFLFTDL